MPRPDETWMWERARSLLDQADRLQRQFFQPGGSDDRCGTWEPPVDVFETSTDLWILVALPGVASADIEVRLEGAVLSVRAQRKLPAHLRKAALKRLEIPRGTFQRRLLLAPGTYALGQSEVADGCLTLNLKKQT